MMSERKMKVILSNGTESDVKRSINAPEHAFCYCGERRLTQNLLSSSRTICLTPLIA